MITSLDSNGMHFDMFTGEAIGELFGGLDYAAVAQRIRRISASVTTPMLLAD